MKKTDYLLQIIFLTLLYYLSGLYSLENTVKNSIVTISPFFSEGFALAFVLIYGPRVITGVFLGQLILAIDIDYQLIPSTIIAFTNSIEALLAYYLFKKFDFDIRLLKLKDIYIFIATVIFILQPFSAICGVLTLNSFNLIHHNSFLNTLLSWYFGNILGQILITPSVLYLYNNYKDLNYFKLIVILLFFAIFTYTFITIIPLENISVLFSVTLIPLIFLLSYEKGLGYAIVSVFVISIVSIYTYQHHVGIFSIYSEMNNLVNINFYILSRILIVLILGVLIVEKNHAVKQYKILNDKLEDRVHEEVEKNREKDKIMFFQARLAQIGETISMIAHQWRQPLNNLAIINQSLYIKYKKDNLSDEAVEKFFVDSKSQIYLMSKTIDDFREFYKPNKDKVTFCINDNLVNIINLTKAEFDRYNIHIQRDCLQKVYILGYPNEFSQAILNILNNSKDALIEKQKIDKNITLSLSEDENEIVLTIKDNAGGINEDIKDKIFEPYFSTKASKNGTGLGLYMAKIIIEEHMNGKIDVTNEQDGALFKITFKQIGGG